LRYLTVAAILCVMALVCADFSMSGIVRGPGMELISPANGTTSLKSPLPLKIKFIPRNNVPVDPASVRLTYLKVPIIDLTERVKAYVTKDGLEMAVAEVPPGTHVLRLDLKDAEGRAATMTIMLSVEPSAEKKPVGDMLMPMLISESEAKLPSAADSSINTR
jgi:hypothetical protein